MAMRARLKSLVRRSDLNGEIGTVLGPDPESGKLQMRLDSSRKIVLVTPEHLELEGNHRPIIDPRALHLVAEYIAECNKAFGPGSELVVPPDALSSKPLRCGGEDPGAPVDEEVSTTSGTLFHSPHKHASLLSVPALDPGLRAQLVLARLEKFVVPMVKLHSELLGRSVREVVWTTTRAMARDGLPVHGPVAGYVLLQGCAAGESKEGFLSRLRQPGGAWVLHYLQHGVDPSVIRALDRSPAHDELPSLDLRTIMR